MEQSFGERLKKYRKEKNLTQQELADCLGVSNKTVSRWESEGGYPDVPLLSPLARILGVTMDDLLNEECPVRTLTTQDWQNLLSFGFAIGGGVLFFLLILFVPMPVCYLGYLGCMAYGVYLQRYYSYQSRWFCWSNLTMDFFVNLNLSTTLVSGAILIFVPMSNIEMLLSSFFVSGRKIIVIGILIGIFLLALVLTLVTAYFIKRCSSGAKPGIKVEVHRPTPRQLTPTAGALVLLGFWMLYFPDVLPRQAYLFQQQLYYGLLAGLVLLCIIFCCKRGYLWGLVPTVVLGFGGLLLPLFGKEYALMRNANDYMEATKSLANIYPRFLRPTLGLVVACVMLALLCVVLAMVQIKLKEAGK